MSFTRRAKKRIFRGRKNTEEIRFIYSTIKWKVAELTKMIRWGKPEKHFTFNHEIYLVSLPQGKALKKLVYLPTYLSIGC